MEVMEVTVVMVEAMEVMEVDMEVMVIEDTMVGDEISQFYSQNSLILAFFHHKNIFLY